MPYRIQVTELTDPANATSGIERYAQTVDIDLPALIAAVNNPKRATRSDKGRSRKHIENQ